MVKVIIDDKDYEVEEGLAIIQACEIAGVEVPRFCYHEKLSIAGNCRMCLVDVEDSRGLSPKPVASCAMQVSEGLKIYTKSERVKNAQEGALEFLLMNHPLDCPICDQGGECDLQDQSMAFGYGSSRFDGDKRAVESKDMGPFIKTEMTRCIHCTRCVRFSSEISGNDEIGSIGRGHDMEITTYLNQAVESELSGNVIDLCPVGALTSKPYAFSARPWELNKTETIDVMDAMGSNIRIDSKGLRVMRVLPRLNEDINEEWITDKTRFFWDGLTVQRIDKPYKRVDGSLKATSWKDALELAKDKISKSQPNKISALTGDLVDIETVYALKKLMNNIGSDNFDCRQENSRISGPPERWLFNSTFNGIENSDGCLIIGSDLRKEAPLLNSRLLRKSRDDNYKIGVIGFDNDLTFDFNFLGENPSIVEDILNEDNDFCEDLNSMKKPIMIIGQGALIGNDANNFLNICIELAHKFNFITSDWNGFNVLHSAASRPGAMSIGFFPSENGMITEEIVSNYNNNDLDVLYLLGVDELNLEKNDNCFVIYQGHHGDKGAQIADLVFPAAAFCEQNGLYMNTEGRVQESIRSTFPLGEAKENWEIIYLLANELSYDIGFKNFSELRNQLFTNFPVVNPYMEFEPLPSPIKGEYKKLNGHKFERIIDSYWKTNSIARASINLSKRNAYTKKDNNR
ncbi:MAG: NADH-quinone oxidoreductase subunit G [Rhodobiaceae bacterium]|nr:NADH-quinone oxidoreductase subunit G [Rhodobiaceae bacterium]